MSKPIHDFGIGVTEIGVGDDGVVQQHHQRQEGAGAIERQVARLRLRRGANVLSRDRREWEIEVMRRPGRMIRLDVAAGNPIQQGQLSDRSHVRQSDDRRCSQ